MQSFFYFLNFLFCMGFCVDGNAMDCDTSDQWSGIELLQVFFLTLTFFQQNFQFLIATEEWYR